jgi:hypothetical protein
VPPGAPGRPPAAEELQAKVADCAGDRADEVATLQWDEAADFLRDLTGVVASPPRP